MREVKDPGEIQDKIDAIDAVVELFRVSDHVDTKTWLNFYSAANLIRTDLIKERDHDDDYEETFVFMSKHLINMAKGLYGPAINNKDLDHMYDAAKRKFEYEGMVKTIAFVQFESRKTKAINNPAAIQAALDNFFSRAGEANFKYGDFAGL